MIIQQPHFRAAPSHEAIEGIHQGVLVCFSVELAQLLSRRLEPLDDGRTVLTLGGQVQGQGAELAHRIR
jgi:hypothetical protein